MFVRDQVFSAVDGVVRTALETGLSTWTGLTVELLLPDTMTRRVVTVTSVGGPVRGRVQLDGYGINVWADTRTDAKNLALAAMHICESVLPGSGAIAAVTDLVGPREVPDEAAFTVAGVTLSHYYFSFTASVKASNA